MQFAKVVNGLVVSLSPTVTSTDTMVCGNAVAVGWMYISDTHTFCPVPVPPTSVASPTAAQLASTLAQTTLAAGLNVVSTSTPSLNGNYSLTPTAQNNVNAVITYILLNNTFPGGSSTTAWADSSGNAHVFPSTAEFKAFATAVANFVAAVSVYGDSGGTQGAIPANNVTIA